MEIKKKEYIIISEKDLRDKFPYSFKGKRIKHIFTYTKIISASATRGTEWFIECEMAEGD